MSAQRTERIKLWGIVQGVGFRPFVAKTAHRLQMKGTVLNIGGLVEITLTDRPERIDAFLETLQREKPEPAEIVHIRRTVIDTVDFADFRIVQSGEGDDEAAMIPPDMAICPRCLEELYDPENPRYLHPFISCMVCGPRYSIIDRIPYDRDNTSMIDFPMCGFCESQYTDLRDRRHHAQTISCHDCGPYLKWTGNGAQGGGSGAAGEMLRSGAAGEMLRSGAAGEMLRSGAAGETRPGDAAGSGTTGETRPGDGAILDHAAAILRSGGVIAFKCVGGYNLVADPFNDEAVRRLREIKGRETKPFAVMFRSLEQIRQYCHVDPVEARLLESSARPIILLEHRLAEEGFTLPEDLPAQRSEVLSTDDLLRSRFIGSFLPSLAAQYLLLDRTGPLIFTSANLSDQPMIKDDGPMGRWMASQPLIDGMISNDRQIRVRMDDSVTRVIDGQPQMIRRSKGYAPLPLYVDTAGDSSGESLPRIFAAGGQLKNSFVLSKGPFLYMSQYFGDMDTEENQNVYRENVDRMAELFRIKPELAVCDMHPLYETSRFAEEYAKATDIPLLRVQHHHAHVASVMAENNLTGKVIGVSFDGTGYGTDGKIWGGEFLLCEGGKWERLSHLRYIDMIGGDSSMKDARRSALSWMAAAAKSGAGLPVGAGESGAKAAVVGVARLDAKAAAVGAAEPGAKDAASASPQAGASETQAGISAAAGPPPADEQGCRQIDVDLSDIFAFGSERIMGCPDARLILRAIDTGVNTIQSSSMGRLFDAVSCLLDICDYNRYEGQCAIMLEDAAAFAQKHPGEDKASDLALAFHQRIIDMIVSECLLARENTGADQVALTGGTFQNKILMEGVLSRLRELGFHPYYNISVSPNDGGIALGQAFIAMHRSL